MQLQLIPILNRSTAVNGAPPLYPTSLKLSRLRYCNAFRRRYSVQTLPGYFIQTKCSARVSRQAREGREPLNRACMPIHRMVALAG